MEGEDVLGGAGLGETEPGATGVGGASQWLSPPSASSTSSSNNSAEYVRVLLANVNHCMSISFAIIIILKLTSPE